MSFVYVPIFLFFIYSDFVHTTIYVCVSSILFYSIIFFVCDTFFNFILYCFVLYFDLFYCTCCFVLYPKL